MTKKLVIDPNVFIKTIYDDVIVDASLETIVMTTGIKHDVARPMKNTIMANNKQIEVCTKV